MFEDDLSRTLSAVAQAAPPGDLLAGMAELRRRRQRRRAGAALAACAVAVVVGVITALVGPASPVPPPAAPSPLPTDLAARMTRAIVQVPARSPDGHEYKWLEAIDAHRLLLLTERSIDRYDTSTGEITSVAGLPRQAELRMVRANERHVVWMINVESPATGQKRSFPHPGETQMHSLTSSVPSFGTFEYWTVPLSGGTPRKLPQTLPGTFDVFGDDLITIEASGARRTPLSGGPSQAIPGAENAVALDLPWLMLATESAAVGQEPAALLNVVTGEQRELAADLCTSLFCLHSPPQGCSADWCIGEDLAGEPIARRSDGSRTLRLPGGSAEPPALNRFAILDGGRRLFDLATGSSAVFDPPGSADIPPFSTDGGRRLMARSAGDVLWVVNLQALI